MIEKRLNLFCLGLLPQYSIFIKRKNTKDIIDFILKINCLVVYNMVLFFSGTEEL